MYKKILIGCICFFIIGCPKKPVKIEETKIKPTVEEPSTTEEPSVRREDWQQIPELITIYFDFDKYDIREDQRANLQKNAEFLKDRPEYEILIEGNCDERGTTEYNLALGQKRGQSVRDYLINLGISGGRIATISFGEEKPVCFEANEECWQKNRRCDFKVRSRLVE